MEKSNKSNEFTNLNVFFQEIPVWKKFTWTFEEAAKMTNVGEHALRDLAKRDDVPFVLKIGTKTLLKRELLLQYLDGCNEV